MVASEDGYSYGTNCISRVNWLQKNQKSNLERIQMLSFERNRLFYFFNTRWDFDEKLASELAC